MNKIVNLLVTGEKQWSCELLGCFRLRSKTKNTAIYYC